MICLQWSESPPARQGATVVPSGHLVKPTKWSCEHTSDSNNSGKRKDTVEQVRAEAGKSRRWGEQHKVNQNPY